MEREIWGNIRHKSHKSKRQSKPSLASLYEAMGSLPVSKYVGQPPINRNAEAPTMKEETMTINTNSISVDKINYWKSIGYSIAESRGATGLIDGGHLHLGTVIRDRSSVHVEADIERQGDAHRVLFYEGSQMIFTIRIVQVGSGWYTANAKAVYIALDNTGKTRTYMLGENRYTSAQDMVCSLFRMIYLEAHKPFPAYQELVLR